MQFVREVAHPLLHALVAAQQHVVAEHRRHRDREADGRHDQGFADGARDLVDRRLSREADRDQGVVDAPDRAEQPTNGAVEPTEASTGSPDCMRLMTISAVRLSASDIHSLASMAPDKPRLVELVVLVGLLAGFGERAERIDAPLSLLIASVRLVEVQNSVRPRSHKDATGVDRRTS
jgi:hypothetical protein